MFVALHDATNAGVHRKFTISLAKIYIYCKIKTNLLLYCIIPFYIIFFLYISNIYKERKIVWIKVYYAKLFMSRETSKVFVAGSNANLLSKELGTFLTGRYVTMELYPFSFHEFLKLEQVAIKQDTFYAAEGKVLLLSEIQKYLGIGNFPQYIQSDNDNYLLSLYTDIIYKDVVVRNKISNERQLGEMMYYLASNATHRFAYNSVTKAVDVKSPDTIKSYIGFVEDTYLVRQLSII